MDSLPLEIAEGVPCEQPQLIPLKRKAAPIGPADKVAQLVQKHPEIPKQALTLRRTQISWMKERQKERNALISACTKILTVESDASKVQLLHQEATRKVTDFDCQLLVDYQKLADEQSTLLRSAGLVVIKPPPLSRDDFIENRNILRLLLINHT
ncbi:hypothetical protein PSACC_03513 [Paramicrosporidium saccamoebae]|uniref:Uncharacterized protein n=1 Tax=Paramicrosporidium saccamoebae TaxID=1246581 RepID=A0A2H9TFV5_9FUNG|nr:hypothetical protein PSACC_03513 [Paramicrosporidium saccamoebae]